MSNSTRLRLIQWIMECKLIEPIWFYRNYKPTHIDSIAVSFSYACSLSLYFSRSNRETSSYSSTMAYALKKNVQWTLNTRWRGKKKLASRCVMFPIWAQKNRPYFLLFNGIQYSFFSIFSYYYYCRHRYCIDQYRCFLRLQLIFWNCVKFCCIVPIFNVTFSLFHGSLSPLSVCLCLRKKVFALKID